MRMRIFGLFLVFLKFFGNVRADGNCEPLHAQAHGINLVCCSLSHTLPPSCEFSSLCREHCSCFLTITRDLNCTPNAFDHDYKWYDHRPNSSPLPCRKPNFPNQESPYSIVVEEADPGLTYQLLLGACSLNVTSITFQTYEPIFDNIDFSVCFPNLVSFQVVLLQRKRANFAKSIRDLQNLTTLSLVNVDFNFWLQPSPFLETLTYLHVENSSLTELPKWLARSLTLSTVYLKNTRLSSLAVIAQLPSVRSLKLSHNLFEQLHRHVFVSKVLLNLDLSYNKITSFGSHTFGKCSDLRILDLSANPIKMLPYKPFSRNSRLKWLKLSRTNVTTLSPDHFHGLQSLKTLTLSKMPLQSISAYAFLPLKSLRYLDLDSCNLTRIPAAVTQNCHLTRLNLANNLLHRASSLAPEVLAVLSGLAQLRIEGNPLTEFPPSFLLISRENTRLLRQLLHSTMTLPLWIREPCTPYYWAMHITNRTTFLQGFLAQHSPEKMQKSGLGYCSQQFDWMKEQMDVYRELDKNSGCSTARRLRSHVNFKKPPKFETRNCSGTTRREYSSPFINGGHFNPSTSEILIASISTNFVLVFLLLTCLFIGCTYEKKTDV